MSWVAAFTAGVIFSMGLVISGMTDPANIRGFLDILGNWRPHLALVMGAALAVTFPFFQWGLPRLKRPLAGGDFHLPLTKLIDKPLIIGALLFGAGWGLSGLCPGPAIAAIAYLEPKVLGFIVTMIIGFKVADFVRPVMGR
jgi:uncharacterized membrane protein YedE/YeeE